jgi:hypothetical protein
MYRRRLTLISLLLATALFVVVPAVQAASPIEATLKAEGNEWTVGDPVQLTLAVTHPADHTVIMPELGENWGDLIVRSQSPATTTSNEDGTETTSQAIDVRLFAPGTFATPPLAITVSDGVGELVEVTAPPIELTITSVLVEGDAELRDIKPQAELPFSNLLPWIASGVAVAAILGGASLLWRRRRARLALATVDNRPPHVVALDELARVEKLGLPESGRFKEHYTLVSDCIRTYVERTYSIPVLERTTYEVQESLKTVDFRPDVARLFISFLDESDLVKFSKFRPDVLSAYQLLAGGRQIVEMTQPILVETKPDTARTTDDETKFPTGSDRPSRRAHQQSEVTL